MNFGGFFFQVLAIFLAGIWGLEAAAASAQEVSVAVISLEQAVERALSRHPEIAAASHHLEAGHAAVETARSSLYPQVYLAEKFNHTNNPMWAFGTRLNQQSITREDFDPDRLNDPAAVSNFNTSLAFTWELFNGGRTRTGFKQALWEQEIASVSLQQTRQEIIALTARAYIGHVLAVEHKRVIEQARETARAHLAFIRSRYEGGFVVKSDLLRAQVRQAELEQEDLAAESRVNVARAALNTAMGSLDNPPLQTPNPFREREETEHSMEAWIAKALTHHPDLKRLELVEQIAEKEIEKAKAHHWPNLYLMGSYDVDTRDFSDAGDSYAVGAMARLDLYSGGRTQAGILAGTAARKRAGELKKSARLQISLKTRQAYYEAQSARRRIAVAQGALEQAEEGLRIVENRYRNGMLTLVSLLDAETALREARLNHFRALHDYTAARIALALSAGTLDREGIH